MKLKDLLDIVKDDSTICLSLTNSKANYIEVFWSKDYIKESMRNLIVEDVKGASCGDGAMIQITLRGFDY